MSDLGFAMTTMALVAGLLAIAAARLAARPKQQRSFPNAAVLVSFFLCVSLILLFMTKDRLMWAHWLTGSASIVWSNWTVLTLAIAAGASWRLPSRGPRQKLVVPLALAALATATLVQPILQPVFRPANGGNSWVDGDVCIQSSPHNCSAAAGATLLRTVGIDVTEQQMVQWCLTDARGTPSLGLWRGLSLATEATRVKPNAASVSAEKLISEGPWPSVLVVGLPRYGADHVYDHDYGWAPGFRHSVVLFGVKPDGMLDIGDPSIGRETWSQKDLLVLYRGEAITLTAVK